MCWDRQSRDKLPSSPPAPFRPAVPSRLSAVVTENNRSLSPPWEIGWPIFGLLCNFGWVIVSYFRLVLLQILVILTSNVISLCHSAGMWPTPLELHCGFFIVRVRRSPHTVRWKGSEMSLQVKYTTRKLTSRWLQKRKFLENLSTPFFKNYTL